MPPIQGRSTSGTTTEPSACWLIFQHGDQGARMPNPERSRCARSAAVRRRPSGIDIRPPGLNSPSFDTDETSSHSPQPGAQTSTSYVMCEASLQVAGALEQDAVGQAQLGGGLFGILYHGRVLAPRILPEAVLVSSRLFKLVTALIPRTSRPA